MGKEAHIFHARGWEGEADFCEFRASLIDISKSKQTRTTQ